MGILDVFIDFPKNIQNVVCCSARSTDQKLGDSKKSNVLGPRRSSIGGDKELCGVGIVFQDQHKDGLYVSSLLKGGPAFLCHQIHAGDILVDIDGFDVSNLSLAELGPHILGKPGSQVKLTFKGQGGGGHSVEGDVED
mmetsp:Transcript_26533/g.64049  ORF Transcript_26533/g.64049 Transcript_26533/m.64049 type:complete len:138 (+) Transcript_26533:257-670(+)